MSRRPPELSLDALGDLTLYTDVELSDLREKLLDDLSRIEQENRQCDRRIKDFNVRKHELNQERADRARAIRAIKDVVHRRRFVGPSPSTPRGRLRSVQR